MATKQEQQEVKDFLQTTIHDNFLRYKNTYRPRVQALLVFNDDIKIPLLVKEFNLQRNDHNTADTLRMLIDGLSFGGMAIDPRFINNGICMLWCANADDYDDWNPSDENLIFIGRVNRAERHGSDDEAPEVELECEDYTSFFLLAKPFASSGVPNFSQTLDDAWRLICENTPGAEELADNIAIEGVPSFPVIGQSVPERFRKVGKIVVNPGDDAWTIWQRCVGALGLISFFYLDQCVVATSQALYTAKSPAAFIYGHNIMTYKEIRNNNFQTRGVGIQSSDPIKGTVLEALYPPQGDPRVNKGKTPQRTGKKKNSKSKKTVLKKDNEDRDFFRYPGISDQKTLDELAQRVYEERAKQEFEGFITTAEMDTHTLDYENIIDLLPLRTGEIISVKLDNLDFIISDPDFNRLSNVDKFQKFKELGYSNDLAKLLAKAADEAKKLRSQFYMKSMMVDYSVSENGGTFKITINYINKIIVNEEQTYAGFGGGKSKGAGATVDW